MFSPEVGERSPLRGRREEAVATYTLVFDPSGKTHSDFTVPQGKVVYLVRSAAVSAGTATVQDLISLTNYVIPDGQTTYLTDIAAGQSVSLAFMERSNQSIHSVNAEVTNKREGTD
jgi:hypothetical protein